MNNYVGWSVYTGPLAPIELWPHSPWIAAKWCASRNPQKDIQLRVQSIVENLKLAREKIREQGGDQGQETINFLLVPEFYFHSTHGPYPLLDGCIKPFRYIREELIKAVSELDAGGTGEPETWIIGAGSALTCNVENVSNFLKNPLVKRRLKILNELLKELHKTKAARARMRERWRHIKAKSYMTREQARPGVEAAINQAMFEFIADPLCVVRNRGVLLRATFGNGPARVESWSYEKQNLSAVDLTMGILEEDGSLNPGDMITEWMVGYPSLSIIHGDKHTPVLPGARITIEDVPVPGQKLELGIEICLDHRYSRLRRTVGMKQCNGAIADNPPLDVQLITSGGMQILDYAVAAGKGGAIFNCDGCDPILDQYYAIGEPAIADSGAFKTITAGVYTSSAQTVKVVSDHRKYFSHSQLSFRYGPDAAYDLTGYDNAQGFLNKIGPTFAKANGANQALDRYAQAQRVPGQGKKRLFAGGLGELHLYLPGQESSES